LKKIRKFEKKFVDPSVKKSKDNLAKINSLCNWQKKSLFLVIGFLKKSKKSKKTKHHYYEFD